MRVLLDEQLDWRLKNFFDESIKVTTVHEQGWSGVKNGELLRRASREFDVLITMDKGFENQQNLPRFSIGFIVIRAISNRRQDIQPLMPEINRLVRSVKEGELIVVSTT